MPLHFAAARKGAGSRVAHHLTLPAVSAPANDDPAPDQEHALMREALLHFAAHGLGAGRAAYAAARAALANGDAEGAEHWEAVCRMLDPRLARSLSSAPTRERRLGKR